jgi:hypothetical protein
VPTGVLVPSREDSLERLSDRGVSRRSTSLRRSYGWYYYVPSWVYYVVAVFFTLLTLPMYWYMAAHWRGVPSSHVVDVVQQRSVHAYVDSTPLVSDVPSRRSLLPGELCEGGYVVLKNGHSYTQGLDSHGRPSRCEGLYLLVR